MITVKRLRMGMAVGLIGTLPVLVFGTAPTPTKIKPGFNLFSTKQDLEIGRQSAAEIERTLPMLQDRQVVTYVNAIGKRLAAVIPGAKFPYQFKVVDASDINAFALPGGYMYLNRGLIEAAKTEGQLAGVVAHEMSHVALRHGTNQASKAYLSQAGLGLLGGLLSKDDDRSTEKIVGAVGGFGLNALFLKFSRTDEEQADILGAQTLAKAGYDPQGMVDFFEVLRGHQSRNPSKVEQFFSSHPAPQDRAARIRSEMNLLTIRPTEPVGGLSQAQANLAAMPAARSMQQIAQNPQAPPPARTVPPNPRTVGTTVAAPSTTFRSFQARSGLFRIEHPSNWKAYPAADGLGVTLAPPAGLVNAGGPERELVQGVVINHYAPFDNDDPGDSGGFDGSSSLATATNDLVGQIIRTNPTLKVVPNSQRTEKVAGAPAMSLVLLGSSAVTGEEERVTVYTRELPDDHVLYALLIAPGSDGRSRGIFTRMLGTLRVSQHAAHR